MGRKPAANSLTPDEAFALCEAAAVAGVRAPQGRGDSPIGLRSADTTALALAGRIRVEIYAWNWRVIEILVGPNAGKRTLAAPHGQKPWKIIDQHGSITRCGFVRTAGSASQPSAPRPLTRAELER